MIQIRTVCPSAHLDSFCRKLDELRGLEFCYQTDDPGTARRIAGWSDVSTYKQEKISNVNTKAAEDCELLIDMLREPMLFEQRASKKLPSIYISERWFKPIHGLPGWVRLFVPSYFKMARRYAKLMDLPNVWLLPCGVHAVRDFIRVYNFFHGKWWKVWREPKNKIERNLGGAVEGFPRMKLWAYFVPPSTQPLRPCKSPKPSDPLRVLWAGRMIRCKRVDVLIKAVRRVVDSGKRKIALTLIGEGRERSRLEKLAKGANYIEFSSYVTNDKLRELMHKVDVYVMPSNGEEGWGAAVSEALSEGCSVISTFEAGSSATLLDDSHLYHANKVKDLAKILANFDGNMVKYNDNDWSGEKAAEIVMEILK